MAQTTIPTLSVDFTSPEVNRDPFTHLARVREQAAAVFNPLADRWMIARYREGRQVLTDEATFEPDREFFDEIWGARVFEADDNPRHNETRGVWNASFTRPSLETLRDTVATVVDECLGEVLAGLRRGEVVDAMPAAYRVSLRMLTTMLGLPEEDIPQFRVWAVETLKIAESFTEPPWTEHSQRLRAAGLDAQRALCGYAGQELQRRRDEQRDDDLTGLMALAPIDRSEAERQVAIAQLVGAGHDTTAKLIGHMLVTFAAHPRQRAAIRADPALIPQAVEEVMRWAGVIGAAVRKARVDTEIDGIPIPAGAGIFVLPTPANRDPRRWPDPDAFDVFRERQAHIGFGVGTHVCLGLNLARLEAQVALEWIVAELGDYALADAAIDYGTDWFTRGPKAVALAPTRQLSGRSQSHG